MNICDIDPNFKALEDPAYDICYYSYTDQPIEINGLYNPRETRRMVRMPEKFIQCEELNQGMRQLIHHTAGGRLRFATNSPYLAVMVELSEVPEWVHMPVTAHSGVDMYICPRGASDYRYRKTFMPEKLINDSDRIYQGVTYFRYFDSWVEHEVLLNLPLYNGVNKIYIGIQEGSSLFAPVPYRYSKPVCFYGDSITQGGCASRPGNNYPNHLSRWLDCDFINLGFSGSAAGEPEMADYIGSLDVSAIVVNMELRAYDFEVFRQTYEPFYKRLRKNKPDTPIILMSRGAFPKVHKYGPYNRDFVSSNRVIMETCSRAWAAGDEKLYYIDGETLFGDRDQDACTVDYTHPNDIGFLRMAERIHPVLQRALESGSGFRN